MLRTASRTAVRSAPRRAGRARRFATHAEHAEQEQIVLGNPTKEWVEKKAAVEHHAGETTDLWRKISFYGAIPATLLATLWVRRVENQHAEHEAHIKAEHDGELPPVPEYDYLNRRVKPFPWGVNSLFFNPHVNKDMSESE